MSISGTAPVYLQIAENLRPRRPGWEQSGWPTVREVAGEFNVSVVTASRAIQALKNSDEPAPIRARWGVCLHVSPGPYYHAAYQVTAAGFRELGRRGRDLIDFDSVRLDDDPADATVRDRVQAAAAAGVSGLFLLPSRVSPAAAARDEAFLAAAAAAGVRVVLLERNLRGAGRPLARDLVCIHDFAGGLELTRHLYALGRTRVAFVGGSPTSSLAERMGGYLTAAVAEGAEPLVVEEPAGVSAQEACRAVVDRLLALRVGGVVCYHDHAAIGVIVEMLRRGVRVPEHVAVAGFYNMPIGESFTIGLTTYDFPAVTVAQRAVDQMRWRLANPDAPPVKLVVPGTLVVRDSTDPAAAH